MPTSSPRRSRSPRRSAGRRRSRCSGPARTTWPAAATGRCTSTRSRPGSTREGNPVGWRHRIVGQSILTGTPFEAMMVAKGVDGTSVEGAANLPYAIPHLAVDLVTTTVGVPVLWWRSVGSTHTAYATEVMIDELAAAAGKDPVEFRLALLQGPSAPRRRAQAGRREGRLGHAAARGPLSRRRGARVVLRPSSPRSPRSAWTRKAGPRSSAWSAPSIAASRSIRT